MGGRAGFARVAAQGETVSFQKSPAEFPGLREVGQTDHLPGGDGPSLRHPRPPGIDLDAGGPENPVGREARKNHRRFRSEQTDDAPLSSPVEAGLNWMGERLNLGADRLLAELPCLAPKFAPMKTQAAHSKGPGSPGVTRRDFLVAGACAAGALTLAPRQALGAGEGPPSEKLNIAGIGVGGMGAANLANLEGQNIVALCDVDQDYAAKTFKKYPKARVWTDYREMLEKQKDIEAVVIATPDHTHAVIAMAAMGAGKHVYCQKPLTHDVFEARKLAQAAKGSRVTTQMGNQGHSAEGVRLICEWIWDGAIGEVREVDAWCDLSYYPWGHEWWSTKWSQRPADTPAVPPTLNWDLWLGPARQRPYHPAYLPSVWRAWWDFGNGMMGDRGAHTLDAAVWALKLGYPARIHASSCGLNADVHPVSAMVTYDFPERENLPPVKLTWWEGLRAPWPEGLDKGWDMPKEGGI